MALKELTSFSSGELDPALTERTNLQKFKSGLKTARNWVIGKTGRLLTRAGRKFFVATKLTSRKVIIHALPQDGVFVEWGHQYVRVYGLDGTLENDFSHALTEDDLDLIQIITIGRGTLLICKDGVNPLVLDIDFGFVTTLFDLYTKPSFDSVTITNAAASGAYNLDYAATYVIDGVESAVETTANGEMPTVAGDNNAILVDAVGHETSNITEMKIYRRPRSAGAFGYVGSTSSFSVPAATHDLRGAFTDYGGDADYTHTPPTFSRTMRDNDISTPLDLNSRTAINYQQRLIFSSGVNLEASRTGHINNFTRDYPLSDDSALSFKTGSGGYAEVLRMVDSDGLVVFTRDGIYINRGAIGISNLGLAKKGDWLIDERVPPIVIPGGVLFIDVKTNTVRTLNFSQEREAYIGEELSIFSDHLFAGNRVVSWAFENGPFPLLWVVFSDGTYASFTYEPEHEMKAWTRHDSGTNIEYVASTVDCIDFFNDERVLGQVIFVVKNGTARNIEISVPRYVSADIAADDPESDKNQSIAAMDSMVSWSSLENDNLVGSDEFELTPVVADTWDGELTLTCGTSALFPDPGNGEVGTIFRYFNLDDKTEVDLEVTARASDNSVTVMPSVTFPSEYGSANPRLYLTAATVSGLSHLEGEDVAVIADGYVLASPNNDIENYSTVTVSSGSITLPSSRRGAIIHVGRPYTMDIETLDIDTVEQRPTQVESITLNKLYIRVHNSRGLYVGNKFPSGDGVDGMEALDSYDIDYEDDNPIIGNRYDQPQSKRVEMTIPGDWRSQGRVCIRQVDPIHSEILSIIPDIDDQRR